jgi:hypothetical protein
MTAAEPTRGDLSGKLEKAVTGLGDLRELLLRADRGEVGAGEFRGELVRFWQGNKDGLTQAAAAVGEQIRHQLLRQLYEWRAQLQRQLPPR